MTKVWRDGGPRRDQHGIIEVFRDLGTRGVDILTVGSICGPRRIICLSRAFIPDEFEYLREQALRFGFRHVESGPLVGPVIMHMSTPTPLPHRERYRSSRRINVPTIVAFQKDLQQRMTTPTKEIVIKGTV